MKLQKFWANCEIPIYIMVGWAVLATVVVALELLPTTGLSIAGLIVIIAAFAYVGFLVIKSKESIGSAAKHGAFAGVIYGLVSAVIGVLSFYLFPVLYQEALESIVAQGQPEATAKMFMTIGIYANIVILPIIWSLLGAGIAALSALVSKKILK